MSKTLTLFCVLFVTWLLISGHYSGIFLIFGLLSCAFTVWVALRMGLDQEGYHVGLIARLAVFWGWLWKEMCLSGWQVTQIIWKKDMALKPYLAWVTHSQKSDLTCAIYANAITLTPGTVAIEVESKRLLIHALEPQTHDLLHEGEMDRRVARFNPKDTAGKPVS